MNINVLTNRNSRSSGVSIIQIRNFIGASNSKFHLCVRATAATAIPPRAIIITATITLITLEILNLSLRRGRF
jgi:hypothetical protein